MISASHNPFPDNGIKLFAAGGRKLSDETETAIEAADRPCAAGDAARPAPASASPVPSPAIVDGWIDAVAGSLDGRRLDGLRVVVDSANGAASVGRRSALFAGLGADVHGHPRRPRRHQHQRRLRRHRHGEPPRAPSSTSAPTSASPSTATPTAASPSTPPGADVDGDQILAVLAVDRRERGRVAGRHGRRHGDVEPRLPPGDGRRTASPSSTPRSATATSSTPSTTGGLALGGEQSGHVIQRDLATTGDGLLTGVHLADVIVRGGRPLADLAAVMDRLPQVLRNVRLPRAGARRPRRRGRRRRRRRGRARRRRAGCCSGRAGPSRSSA